MSRRTASMNRRPFSRDSSTHRSKIRRRSGVSYSGARSIRANHAVSRLAAELHDRVAQSLYSVDTEIASALESLPPDCAKTRAHLESARELTGGAYRDVRRTIGALRENLPYYKDVVEALASILTNFSHQTSVASSFQPPNHSPTWPKFVELQVLAIVHHGLDNIAQHAGASNVVLSLEPKAGGWSLILRDDGRGFAESFAPSPDSPGHYGLAIMGERAESFGGVLSVQSVTNQGTTLTISIPDTPTSRR